jgi:hypothetical protein
VWLRKINSGDCWLHACAWNVTGIASRQSIDADGKVRIVLSARDPGVPNWLDTSGFLQGYAQWRWYLSDRFPVPDTQLVPLGEVRRNLPPATPRVSQESRRQQFDERRRQVGRRFNV